MKPRPLWQLSVATPADAEAAVADLLSRLFETQASAYFDALKRTTTVSVYLSRPPAPRSSQVSALRGELRDLARRSPAAGALRVRMRELPPEDWAESWKQHFQPIRIGGALLLKPSWSRQRACKGQAVVVLDPGLSFGTGQHATTGFCLRELVARRRPGSNQSFLDAGTGSGILAIAAVKLGYAPVQAFDFDLDAVRVACANARRNRVAHKLQIRRQDVAKLPARPGRRHDLVCANLLAPLLIAERRRIAGLAQPGGALVLAGILRREFAEVRAAYEELGLRCVTSCCEREWRSGSFILPR